MQTLSWGHGVRPLRQNPAGSQQGISRYPKIGQRILDSQNPDSLISGQPRYTSQSVSAFCVEAVGVTIYDIADRADVSIATVSRVLNKNPRVSSQTRARVLRVAQELGYQPHVSAQSLARRKSSLVSAVIPMVTNYFFMEVLRGLQDRLGESDYDLLVYAARTMDEADVQIDRSLHRGRSAGVLIFSSPLKENQLDRLRAASQPTVLVDCYHPDFDAVSIDNEQGGYLATRHLLDQGRERIGLIMGYPGSVPAKDRLRGYRRALEQSGRAVDERLIVASDDAERHGFNEAYGFEAMGRLLDTEAPVDAVFATSDVQALGAISALRSRRLKIPRDVAVIGFDDVSLSRHIGLSTLRQPMYDMGRLATEKLLARIQDPERIAAHTVFAPRLVARRSTTGVEEDGVVVDDRRGAPHA